MAVNSFKQDEQSGSMKKTALFLRLFHYLLDYKISLTMVCLIMAVTTAVSIINPLIMEAAVDNYIKPKDFSGLLRIVSA